MKSRFIFPAILLSCCWLPQAQAHELPEKAVDDPAIAEVEGFAIPKDGVNDKVYPVFKKTLSVSKSGNSSGGCWKKASKTLTFDYYIKSDSCGE